MDRLLKTCNLLRLNNEEIENLNKSITRNEIKSVIKKLLQNQTPDPDDFTGEFYQTL